MTEQILIWCGLMCAIGTSCFICGVGIEFLDEQVNRYWSWMLKRCKANTGAWLLFKRVQRRYDK